MKIPKIKIRLKDLDELPCPDYLEFIKKNYRNQKFDPLELIRKKNGDDADLNWLISNCKLAQTEEMMAYYKGLNHNCDSVGWLIDHCEYAQTKEMMAYYKSLNPDFEEVSRFIHCCEFAQTRVMLKYYLDLKPNFRDVNWFICTCEFARTREVENYRRHLS